MSWFAPKRYGYGAGAPISWQGWALTHRIRRRGDRHRLAFGIGRCQWSRRSSRRQPSFM